MNEHLQWLDDYRRTQTGTGWHTAPDDGYLYDHLVHHLKEAGRVDELKALFADQNWMRARITYIPTRESWLYVAGIVDLFSR